MRMEVGHEVAQYLFQLLVWMLCLSGANEGLDSMHDAFGENSVAGTQYFGMVCRYNVLRAKEHLLVKFFAGAHASEFDLDVTTDSETGKPDQIRCDVYNADRLAHV